MQTTTNDLRQDLIHLHKNFFSAVLQKQEAFMTEQLYPEFIFTSPKGVVLDKDGFTKGIVTNPSVNFDQMEMAGEEKIVLVQKGAVVNGRLLVKFRGQDQQFIRYTTSMVYEETGWVLLAFHETYIL